MGIKVTLTQEEINKIINLHMQTGNYSEVSRQTGYSQLIIKRVINEAAEKYNQNLPYNDLNYNSFYEALYYIMQNRSKANV